MTQIHPSAVVDPQAELGKQVEIGPFCIIEAGAVIGDHCHLAGRVTVKSGTILGADNEIAEGTTLGGRAQHLVNSAGGTLVIGRGNRIRENVTIHRGFQPGGETRLGDNNLIMVNSHIAHDCKVSNHCVLVNNVMLAGHVEVHDRAYFGGGAAVHQFCRVGRYAMVGGYARVTKDIPPYVLVDGEGTEIVGLNKVGLKRNGFTSQDLAQLKSAYQVIYRRGLRWNDVLALLAADFSAGPAALLLEFFQGGKRGFVPERRISRKATLKLVKFQEGDDEVRDAA